MSKEFRSYRDILHRDLELPELDGQGPGGLYRPCTATLDLLDRYIRDFAA